MFLHLALVLKTLSEWLNSYMWTNQVILDHPKKDPKAEYVQSTVHLWVHLWFNFLMIPGPLCMDQHNRNIWGLTKKFIISVKKKKKMFNV